MIKEVREVTDKEFELPTEGNNVADQPAENVTSNESLESSAAAIADSFKQDEKTVVEPTAEAIAETIADINSDAAVAVTAMPTKAPKKEKKKKDEYRVSNFDIIKNYHRYTAKEKKHYRYLFWHRIAAYVWPFFRAVIIFGLSFVILYPILYMISTSIRPQAEMNDPSVMWIPKTIRMENFVEVWNAIDYPGTLWNTLILNIVSSVLQVGTCALTGYGFARFKFKGKNFFFALVLLQIIVPVQIILIPQFSQFRYFDIFGLFNALMGTPSTWLIRTFRCTYRRSCVTVSVRDCSSTCSGSSSADSRRSWRTLRTLTAAVRSRPSSALWYRMQQVHS